MEPQTPRTTPPPGAPVLYMDENGHLHTAIVRFAHSPGGPKESRLDLIMVNGSTLLVCYPDDIPHAANMTGPAPCPCWSRPLENTTDAARIAYRAYGESVGWKAHTGLRMPTFDQLPPHIVEAWKAAAGILGQHFRPPERHLPEAMNRAVIESFALMEKRFGSNGQPLVADGPPPTGAEGHWMILHEAIESGWTHVVNDERGILHTPGKRTETWPREYIVGCFPFNPETGGYRPIPGWETYVANQGPRAADVHTDAGLPHGPRCFGDGCTSTATHGPDGIPVACWTHGGDFPAIDAPPAIQPE